MNDAKTIYRPFGLFDSPERLIAQVRFYYDKQDADQKRIAEMCDVPLSTVLGIIAGTWGDEQWYEQAPELERPQRGRYDVDHKDAALNMRVRQIDKDRWQEQANRAELSLAAWVAKTLDAGADYQERYDQSSDDMLHYAHTCIGEAQADHRKLMEMIGVSHRARQQLVNLGIDINRLEFAIRFLVKGKFDV